MNNQLFVIPLDGSPDAAESVDRLGPMLTAGDRAILLRVRDGRSQCPLEAIAEAERKLESRGITVSREEPEATDAAAGIVDFVGSKRPDLVLMEADGASHRGRGSVAERVLRFSPVPLLMIGPESTVDAPFRSVLVPTDTTEFSTAVLEPLIPLVRGSGARITLLFVDWDDPTDTPKQRSSRRRQRLRDVGQWLAEPRRLIEDAGLEAEVRVEHGSVAETILEVAADGDHDLLAMATHGRRGPGRWLLGSMAEKVRRKSAMPLLLHCPFAARKRAAASADRSFVSRIIPRLRTSS